MPPRRTSTAATSATTAAPRGARRNAPSGTVFSTGQTLARYQQEQRAFWDEVRHRRQQNRR